MKITDIKTYIMDAFRTNWTFIKVETDEGIYGWGEASLGTQEMALSGCVEDLKRLIIGRNPFEIEKMRFEVYRDIYWKGGPVLMSAISGIEMALWDIMGKALNVPVYTFFGGKMRDRVKMYANGWFSGSKTPENFAAKAKETVALGVKALKWDPFGKSHMTISKEDMHLAVEIVGAVREAVGNDVELLIECHGRFNPYTAIEISRELAPFKPMLMEEPCPPDNLSAIAEVKKKSLIPIAAGERLFGKWEYRQFLEKQAISVVQPDICHCGGIFEGRKIAAMSELYFGTIAPHNPLGPISLAACLQLDACTPNFLAQEHPGNPDKSDLGVGYIKEPFVIKDGYIETPTKPGLGVELDEEALADKIYDGKWSTPRLYHEDGSVADW